MTEEQISHIFDEFYKADESRHNLDSSGLGLAIAKKIIKKHDGKIWAESKGSGKGTAFFFTLKKVPVGPNREEEQEIQQ
jgi:signal transduction histidine kinase